MNLRKYRFIKIIALLMAFVWLFGSYATGMTGVHATDDFDYAGSVEDDYYGGVYLEEPVVGAMGVVPLSGWPYLLQRRDHSGLPPHSDAPRSSFPTSAVVTQGMTLGYIFDRFFTCEIRRYGDHPHPVNHVLYGEQISSGHPDYRGVRFPYCSEQRRDAFRVFHGCPSTPLPYLEMVDESPITIPFNRVGTGVFQYAYVQRLHFDLNFGGLGGNIEPNFLREVIIYSYYDRMFVDGLGNYGTMRNYLFPVSPNCPEPFQRCPILDGTTLDLQPRLDQRDVVHPAGLIFGGWFTCLDTANNHGCQIGRAWERGMGRVTPYPDRFLYARWYEPTVNKVVNPTEITLGQIAARTPIEYTITIDTVNMPANLINFTVVDELDENLTFVPGSVEINPQPGSDPYYDHDNGVLTFDISGFVGEDPIGDIVITFQVTVNPGATGIIGNIASLYGYPGTGPRCPTTGVELPIYQDNDELVILPDGSITVIVVDDDGNYVPGAKVNLYDDEGYPIGTGVTGEDGRVVFPHLPDGEYRVTVTHPDHPNWIQEREVEIVDASDETVIVVIPGIPPYQPPVYCDCYCECDCDCYCECPYCDCVECECKCDCKCDCPDCDCPDCDCVECECKCDCPPPTTRGRPTSAGRGAPRTGDILSVTPFLSSILFSISAIFGGAALRRRFKK